MFTKTKVALTISLATAILGFLLCLSALVSSFFQFKVSPESFTQGGYPISLAVQLLFLIWGGWLLFKIIKKIQVRSGKVNSLQWITIRFTGHCMLFSLIALTVLASLSSSEYLPGHISSLFSASLLFSINSAAIMNFKPMLKKLAGLDIALTNILMIALGVELGLELISQVKPSPLFYDSGVARQSIEAHRMRPHYPYFDFNCNSSGYLDTEFSFEKEEQLRIAAIGDSFAFGKVPYGDNFLTLTEEHLKQCRIDDSDGITIHNYGIPGSSPTEYAYILKNEVLPTNPDCVLLCIFTGNDIQGFRIRRPSRATLANWWIYKIPRGFYLMQQETAQVVNPNSEYDAGTIPDYMYNPALEKPCYSDEQYARIINRRVELLNANNGQTERQYLEFFKTIDFFKKTLSQRLIVAILPQEIQVNDTLYQAIIQQKPVPGDYIQDYPQQQITDYCHMNDVKCINLLPEFRNREPDTIKYFLQETHWNVAGNRIAAEIVSSSLCSILNNQ